MHRASPAHPYESTLWVMHRASPAPLMSQSICCCAPSPAQPQVMGRLNGFDDDEASIDEDENSDGGAVSIAGDDVAGRGYGLVGVRANRGQAGEELLAHLYPLQTHLIEFFRRL
eukprot:scaffold228088_cov16-Tisochrysis_lutea.AAC.1